MSSDNTQAQRVHERPAHYDAFERSLSQNRQVIVSRCRHCGLIVIGSVSSGLPRVEEEHTSTCMVGKVRVASAA